jgi:intracellular septation protein
MDTLLTFAPLLAFFVAYTRGGIYVATAVLMAGMVLMCGVEYLWRRRVSTLHLASTVLILLFGAATLLLHDPRFIKIKATIFMALLAIVYLGSQWIGAHTITQRTLQAALPDNLSLHRGEWTTLNLHWVVTFMALGAANWWFAFHAPEAWWARFKFGGIPAALLLVAVAQSIWLARRAERAARAPAP